MLVHAHRCEPVPIDAREIHAEKKKEGRKEGEKEGERKGGREEGRKEKREEGKKEKRAGGKEERRHILLIFVFSTVPSTMPWTEKVHKVF